MIAHWNLSLEETLRMFGLSPKKAGWCKNTAKKILPNASEPDWTYMRVDVRKRESGIPELVISVPFKVEGL